MMQYPPAALIGWLAYVMAAIFLFFGLVNLRPPRPFAASYVRWGYPDWWHYVTAAVDLSGAALLLLPQTRFWGAGLLALLSLVATGTLVRHGEISRVTPGLLLFVATAILAVWA